MITITYTRKLDRPETIEHKFGSNVIANTITEKSMTVEIAPTPEQQTIIDQVGKFYGQKLSTAVDHDLTPDEAASLFVSQVSAHIAQREAEAHNRLVAQEAAQRALEKAAEFVWVGGKAVVNLYDKLHTVSEVEFDRRFSNWVKHITNVDMAKTNGFAFEGNLVPDRSIEVKNEFAVYLVAGTSGSNKYQTTNYRVVVLRDGKLKATDICTDNTDAGWALIIRNRVAALLKPAASVTDEFAALREAVKTDTDTVTVDRALLAQLLKKLS